MSVTHPLSRNKTSENESYHFMRHESIMVYQEKWRREEETFLD